MPIIWMHALAAYTRAASTFSNMRDIDENTLFARMSTVGAMAIYRHPEERGSGQGSR
jgi:hypothetical protein